MSARLAIAIEKPLLRDGIRAILKGERRINVVSEVGDGYEALKSLRRMNPDVLLCDSLLPRLNAVELTRRVNQSSLGARVLALTSAENQNQIVELIDAGIGGILLTACSAEDLIKAILTVNSGRTYLSPIVEEFLVEDYRERLNKSGKIKPAILTSREREILQSIAEGLTTKAIASTLHVSTKTVETHRAHIMRKLRLQGIAELTKYAIREGLTSL